MSIVPQSEVESRPVGTGIHNNVYLYIDIFAYIFMYMYRYISVNRDQ
jgi:hypothetical protein